MYTAPGMNSGKILLHRLQQVGGGRVSRMSLRLLSAAHAASSSSHSTAQKGAETIQMAYERIGCGHERQTNPVVICHGLFGHQQNWRSMAKTLQLELGNQVYVVDLRNHGKSPHASEHSYSAMARDVERFLQEVVLPESGFDQACLLGHSMGGKLVATIATNPSMQGLVKKLIIEDIAPQRPGKDGDEFRGYVRAMKTLDLGQPIKRADISKQLMPLIKDGAVLSFLLTSLRFRPPVGGISPLYGKEDDGKRLFYWLFNLDALGKWMDHVIDYHITKGRYAGPTLLIAGEESTFMKPATDVRELRASLFPEAELVVIPFANHWVHSQQPKLFSEAVLKFLKRP